MMVNEFCYEIHFSYEVSLRNENRKIEGSHIILLHFNMVNIKFIKFCPSLSLGIYLVTKIFISGEHIQ